MSRSRLPARVRHMKPAGLVLSEEELRELTGRKVRRSQITELNRLGLTHRRRGDGSIVVDRSHYSKVMGSETSQTYEKPFEPDWSAVR